MALRRLEFAQQNTICRMLWLPNIRSDINPFQQQQKLCPIQRRFIAGLCGMMELTLLQALGPHAIVIAVKVRHIQVGALAVDEHKQVTAGGVFVQLVLDQRG